MSSPSNKRASGEDLINLIPSVPGEVTQFETQADRAARLSNDAYEEMMAYRKEYFKSAKSIAEAWIGVVLVVTIFQIVKPLNLHLAQNEYIALAVSSLAVILGLWWQVGKSVFPAEPPKRDQK